MRPPNEPYHGLPSNIKCIFISFSKYFLFHLLLVSLITEQNYFVPLTRIYLTYLYASFLCPFFLFCLRLFMCIFLNNFVRITQYISLVQTRLTHLLGLYSGTLVIAISPLMFVISLVPCSLTFSSFRLHSLMASKYSHIQASFLSHLFTPPRPHLFESDLDKTRTNILRKNYPPPLSYGFLY